ncbi:uncharacterized protein LOC119776165 [Cyprinodon tularosa]|uniref:uncharacterized protein LOC119776165 n=1 Tax=Cyprinodon tularosa TaxID=77115 RepID=UPI0018E2673F|nr:uncharacterized protein LOC119776165 [Cyprinodon tularosa]
MAAGFIIPRILLLCLVKEVTCASSLQAANARYKMQLDRGPNQDAHGFRRPLHYVRSLRLPKINPESLNQLGKGQTFQKTLLKDLSIGLTPRQSVGHRWSQLSPIQPSPQRIDPLPRPRGFEVSLDFPFLSPNQMKTSGSRVEDLTDAKLKSKSSVYFTVPQFGKKNDDGSASGLHVNLTFTPAVSMKPLKISGPDEKPKDPKNVPLTSYGEPGKWLSTIQTGLKWPSLSQTTAEETKKHGSTWSYPDTGSKQTLHQPYVSIYTRPNQGKLASNTEPLNYKRPQIKLEKPLSQDVGAQRPDSTNPPSLSIVKYIENLDFFKSPTRKDNQIVPPSCWIIPPLGEGREHIYPAKTISS